MTQRKRSGRKTASSSGKATTKKKKVESRAKGGEAILDMMADPRYLRQSAALITEALQKGFDVLQLADGDIVTTGTKTIVYQYSWNKSKGKLLKTRGEAMKKTARRAGQTVGDEAVEAEDA